jgi:hypothetical protein
MYTKHRQELYQARKAWVKTLVRPLPSLSLGLLPNACVAGLYMYSNEVRRTLKDGLCTNLYICVAGLYMYSNEVRRTASTLTSKYVLQGCTCTATR